MMAHKITINKADKSQPNCIIFGLSSLGLLSSRSIVKSNILTEAFLSKHIHVLVKLLFVVVVENRGDRNAKQFAWREASIITAP